MSPLRDYRERCRRKGRPTSEQLSLTARATKSGGSRDGPAGAAARPAKGKYRPGAVTVRRLGDLVRQYLRLGCLPRLCQPGPGPGADGVRPGRTPAARACAARALGPVPACGRGSGSCGPAQRWLVHRGRGRAPVYVDPGGRAAAVCQGAGRLLDRDRAGALYSDGRQRACRRGRLLIPQRHDLRPPARTPPWASSRSRRAAGRRGSPACPPRSPRTGSRSTLPGVFGHRLVVTARNHAATTVLAIDCAGEVRTITFHAPAMEGGIAVAPASFGHYGGDLIAPARPAGACTPSRRTAPWSHSRYLACRTASTSASKAPGSCHHGSALATPPTSPTGTPRGTSTRVPTASCACPARSWSRPVPALGPAGRDRGKRTHHRRALRQHVHRALHRQWPCHQPRRGTRRVHHLNRSRAATKITYIERKPAKPSRTSAARPHSHQLIFLTGPRVAERANPCPTPGTAGADSAATAARQSRVGTDQPVSGRHRQPSTGRLSGAERRMFARPPT